MANGEWRMANGEWRMANGDSRIVGLGGTDANFNLGRGIFLLPTSTQHHSPPAIDGRLKRNATIRHSPFAIRHSHIPHPPSHPCQRFLKPRVDAW
jgi:hypothetical protein